MLYYTALSTEIVIYDSLKKCGLVNETARYLTDHSGTNSLECRLTVRFRLQLVELVFICSSDLLLCY